ncbi:MAG: Asp-tRNA(Asn)/Glu-tRNA(Gln) amidotransferase GatCAB subunit B, partial [Bacteroidota bacterium]|nr:Asp-tRNA(Asn)/Glu-tRNA(Gln) amidotransferase GatCAB subunit B [Bacteroidota bacterium]
DFPVHPENITLLIQLIDEGKINFSIAAARIFPALINHPEKKPTQIATEQNLLQEADTTAIELIIDQVLLKLPEKVKEYQKGKKGLMGLFVGEVIKLSKGKADPQLTNQILLEKLTSQKSI